jgi:hypothetical protein
MADLRYLPSTVNLPSAGQLGYTYFLQSDSFSNPAVTLTSTNLATIPASTLIAGTYLVSVVYNYNIVVSSSSAGFVYYFQMNITQTSAQVGGTPSNTNLSTYASVLNCSRSTGPYIACANIFGSMYLANTATPIYITANVKFTNVTLSKNSAYCQFTRIA